MWIKLIVHGICFLSQEFERMTKRDGVHPDVWTNLACCYFFLGMYPEADEAAAKGKFWSEVV